MHARTVALALLPALLGGCDLLGIETAPQIEAKKEAEGRAIGSACRQAVRSIEDCYSQNAKAQKAAVFAGWREMDQYMRENNLAGMPHSDKALPMITESAADAASGHDKAADKSDKMDKGAEKASDKGGDKGGKTGKPSAAVDSPTQVARVISSLPGVSTRANAPQTPQAPQAPLAPAAPARPAAPQRAG